MKIVSSEFRSEGLEVGDDRNNWESRDLGKPSLYSS